MKALICSILKGPEVLATGEFPEPQPNPGEVRIRTAAASLNYPDGLIVEGRYQFKPQLPFVPGSEAAGIVDAVGSDVTEFSVGDRVGCIARYGAFAERMIASAASVFHLPERMSFTEGAAFGMAYGTSYHALVQQGEISPGKVVLVLGAGGGTGIAAVQIAKALGGLVIAAASSPEKLALAQASGADHAIDYLNRDLKQSVKDLTDGAGANIIYDPIGGALAEAAMRSIAWGGRYLVVGFASGTIPAIPINLALIKSAGIIGVFWGAWVDRAPILNRRNFENLSRLFSEGLLRPPISQEIELEDVPAALRAMLNRELQGKTVIRFPAR